MRIDAGSNKVLVISESGPFMTVVMDESSNQTAIATLFSLEDRLRRLEWYLSGDDEVKDTLQRVIDQGKNNTVQARLGKLENDLDKLSTRSPIVYNLLKLRASTGALVLSLLISGLRCYVSRPLPTLHLRYSHQFIDGGIALNN